MREREPRLSEETPMRRVRGRHDAEQPGSPSCFAARGPLRLECGRGGGRDARKSWRSATA